MRTVRNRPPKFDALPWRGGLVVFALLSWIFVSVIGRKAIPEEARPVSKPTAKSAPMAPQPPVVQDPQTFEKQVRPFLNEHCAKCHGAEKAEAKFRVDSLQADFLNRPDSDHWVEVLNRINLGEMPPEDEPKPTAEALEQVTDWITAELQQARQHSQSSAGKVLLRRLTRFEYANTVRGLLDVDFVTGESPAEKLPPDGAIAGFDRVSRALLLDPSLMDAYLNVAQDVVDRAMPFRPPLVSQLALRYDFSEHPDTPASYQLNTREMRLDGKFLVVMEGAARTYSKLRHPFNQREVPLTGNYRIRVCAAADRGAKGEPIYMDVSYGSTGRQWRFRVDAPREAPAVYEFEKTFDAFDSGEFQVGLVNGTRFHQGNGEWYQQNGEITKQAESGQAKEAMRGRARLRAEGGFDASVRSSYAREVLHVDGLPKLYLEWVELVGPLQSDYPPRSLSTIFGDVDAAHRFADLTDRDEILVQASAIFQRLLPRAFRRPVTAAETAKLINLVGAELDAGSTAVQSLKTGLVAMLCSPEFLFLFEPSVGAPAQPRRLNDYELATRLSYFLWSNLPDAELTRLAGSKSLHEPAALSRQIDRLLADPKCEGFVQGFARQWLKVDEISRFAPDQQIYPDYYATDMVGIEQDVKEEPLAFFREVLRRNEPLASFLDSDWLMLNERLAKLYVLSGVEGTQLPPSYVAARPSEGLVAGIGARWIVGHGGRASVGGRWQPDQARRTR